MATKIKMTDKQVLNEAAAPEGQRVTLHDTLSPVQLRVTDKGAKSWLVNGRIKGGEAIRVTLGTYPKMSLEKAREAARKAAELMEQGRDPRSVMKQEQAEQRQKDADLFEVIAESFIEKHLVKNRTGERDAGLVRRDLIPAWKGRPITDIRRRDVADLIDKLSTQKTTKRKGRGGRVVGGKIAANRRMSLVRKLFNWCLSRGIVEANPAARMERVGEEKARKHTLSDYELRMTWRAAGEIGGPYGGLIRMLMLSAKRRGEVGHMRSELVDRIENVWTSLAEHEKSKVTHLIPLTPAMLEVIDAVPVVGNEWVFTLSGDKPINSWSKSKGELDDKLAELVAKDAAEAGTEPKPVRKFVLHDIRRTVSTGMSELRIDKEVRQKVLNHTDRSVIGEHYDAYEYLKEKRSALERWQAHLFAIIDGKAGSNVVPMLKAGA